MSMPIGVGIVIDDQIWQPQGGNKTSSANQNQQVQADNKGSSNGTICRKQNGNDGTSTNIGNRNPSNAEDAINDIIRQLEENHIPLVKYTDIPSLDVIKQFGQVSFLLLDWKLLSVGLSNEDQPDTPNPIVSPDTLQQVSLEDKLSFLREFHRVCFAPVLLFTHEDIDNDIIPKLKEHHLYQGDGTDFILIKRKSELTSENNERDIVVKTVANWVQSTPVTHLVSEWNRSVISAQSRMFADFFSGSHEWPKHLWQAYKADGANPDAELTSMIAKNMFARINCQFDEATMAAPIVTTSATNDVTAFLELAISIPNRSLNPEHGGGDVFFIQATPEGNARDYPYLLNISCDCDFVRNDQFKALFIGGKVIHSSKVLESNGSLKRPLSKAYILPIHGGKCICFEFGQHEILQPCKLALENRICRLTAPYLTDIRQRYANWIHREGLPVYPH